MRVPLLVKEISRSAGFNILYPIHARYAKQHPNFAALTPLLKRAIKLQRSQDQVPKETCFSQAPQVLHPHSPVLSLTGCSCWATHQLNCLLQGAAYLASPSTGIHLLSLLVFTHLAHLDKLCTCRLFYWTPVSCQSSLWNRADLGCSGILLSP